MKISLFLILFLLFIKHSSFSQNDSNTVDVIGKKIDQLIITGREDSIIFYSQKNLDLSTKINYKRGIARSLSNIGIGYKCKGNYPEALKYYYKSLKLYETIQRPKGIMVQYCHIGEVYDYLSNYKKALDFNFRALKLADSLNERNQASILYCNIGIIFSRQHKFEEAKEYISKALKIDREVENMEGIARNLLNMGFIHSDKNQTKEALNYFLESLSISKQIDDKVNTATCMANIGVAYSSLKQYNVAESYLLQAIAIADEIGEIDLKSQFEEMIYEFYKEIKNDHKALIHYKNYITLRDSIYNKENTRKIVETEMNYEFEKKEVATKFEHDKIVVKLEADNKLHSQQRFFLILFIVIVLVLLFFAKRAYDNKKKIAEFMASENHRKEVLLQEVHHRINNNLQIISSLLTLQANSAENEKLTEYLKQSQNRIQSLSVLHELLYQNDSPLQINMNNYLNKVLDFHRDVLNSSDVKVDIETRIANVIFPTKLAVPLALIVNELVTNSIKYAFKDIQTGKITISLKAIENEKNAWLLSVSDSGKGLPEDTNFRKDSLGLRLVTIMSKQIKGTLTKYNKEGAIFEVRFIV